MSAPTIPAPTIALVPAAPVEAPPAGITVFTNGSVIVRPSDAQRIATRSVQRQRGAIIKLGSCAGVTFADDGAPSSGTTPILEAALPSGQCYQWRETVVDLAGASSSSTSGTVLVDTTAPIMTFVRPLAGGPTLVGRATFPIIFDVTDLESGLGGSNGWSLQRQIAVATGETCGTFANDPAPSDIVTPSSLVTGVKQGRDLVETQNVTVGRCYRWILSARDQAGNEAEPLVSGSIVVDTSDQTPPEAYFDPPWMRYTNTTTWTLSWTESEVGSGVMERSVWRHHHVVDTPGFCYPVKWAHDAHYVPATNPMTVTGLLNGYCYYWDLALTDRAGNFASFRSGYVMIDTTPPTVDFISPNEGTTTVVDPVSHAVEWAESDSLSGIASRTLERQVVAPVGSRCPSSGWTTEQTTTRTESRILALGLQSGRCYRWRVTVSDAAGNSTSVVSGSLLTSAR